MCRRVARPKLPSSTRCGPQELSPSRWWRPIGTALVRAALERLREIGARGCVVVGDPDYYRRFGFTDDVSSLVVPEVPPERS
ncbi:MAG: hypothetical protein WA944_01480 [Mycobacterium sp.]